MRACWWVDSRVDLRGVLKADQKAYWLAVSRVALLVGMKERKSAAWKAQ